MTRQRLTDAERHALLERQHGLCCVPGCMSEGPFEADHAVPNAWEPGKPTQLLCIPCHRAKTKLDVKAIAKAKRLRDHRTQYDKRQQSGAKIKGAPFRAWRTFSGAIRFKDQNRGR